MQKHVSVAFSTREDVPALILTLAILLGEVWFSKELFAAVSSEQPQESSGNTGGFVRATRSGDVITL